LEVAKIFTAVFIESDSQMLKVDPETGELLQCKAQSIQLTDETGQIDYIFCDKTGTLTKNELKMREISVNGKLYESNDNSLKTLLSELNKNREDVKL